MRVGAAPPPAAVRVGPGARATGEPPNGGATWKRGARGPSRKRAHQNARTVGVADLYATETSAPAGAPTKVAGAPAVEMRVLAVAALPDRAFWRCLRRIAFAWRCRRPIATGCRWKRVWAFGLVFVHILGGLVCYVFALGVGAFTSEG